MILELPQLSVLASVQLTWTTVLSILVTFQLNTRKGPWAPGPSHTKFSMPRKFLSLISACLAFLRSLLMEASNYLNKSSTHIIFHHNWFVYMLALITTYYLSTCMCVCCTTGKIRFGNTYTMEESKMECMHQCFCHFWFSQFELIESFKTLEMLPRFKAYG